MKRLTLKRKKAITAYCFLMIPILFYFFVRIFPAFQALSMSFSLEGIPGFTIENYERLIHDEVFWRSVWNTFLYVLIIVPLQIGFGLLIAIAIERANKFRWLYRILFFLPYMTSTVAISWVWRLIYEPSTGVLNQLMDILHLPAQGWLNDPSTALISVSVVIIWQMAGFCMLIYSAGLQVIPQQYYEAAKIDGANKWKSFWKITIPMLHPTTMFLAIIGVIQTLQAFTQIANLTGGSSGSLGGPLDSTMSVVIYMYKEGFTNYDLHYAAASTVLLFILILTMTLIQFKVFNKSYRL